jgi:hypothetical protein
MTSGIRSHDHLRTSYYSYMEVLSQVIVSQFTAFKLSQSLHLINDLQGKHPFLKTI